MGILQYKRTDVKSSVFLIWCKMYSSVTLTSKCGNDKKDKRQNLSQCLMKNGIPVGFLHLAVLKFGVFQVNPNVEYFYWQMFFRFYHIYLEMHNSRYTVTTGFSEVKRSRKLFRQITKFVKSR